MTLIELNRPEVEPVSLAEAKAWARIERNDEDALVERLIRAAREAVEAQTGLILARRGFRLCLEKTGGGGFVDVGRGPLRSIVDVHAYTMDGTPEEFGAGGASLSPLRGSSWIEVSDAVRQAGWNGIEIELEAGFDPNEVPEALKVAMLRIVATAYEMRAAVSPEMQPGIVPPLAAALIAPFRRVSL